MKPVEAIAFVERHGLVLQSARAPAPNLAEAIAGQPIRGSWWGHPRGREIFRASEAIARNADILVCKLADGKITYVHRRLWPALVRLADRFSRKQLARVWNEHTPEGKHRAGSKPFPGWVPAAVLRQAGELSADQAETMLSLALPFARRRGSSTTRAGR